MKKQRHIQTTRTLLSRFRYWGRKNYAAFASMGREFQIGHLHTNVVDVALRKQNAAQTIPYHTFMTLQEIKDQVLAGVDLSLIHIFQISGGEEILIGFSTTGNT